MNRLDSIREYVALGKSNNSQWFMVYGDDMDYLLSLIDKLNERVRDSEKMAWFAPDGSAQVDEEKLYHYYAKWRAIE